MAPQVLAPVRPGWVELTEEQRAALSRSIQRANDETLCESSIKAGDEAERSGDGVIIPFENYTAPAKTSSPEPEIRFLRAANDEQDFPII